MRYRFAELQLDEETRTFRSERGEIALQPRVFDLLVHLIRNRDRIVSTEEMVESVWGVVAITDGAVQRAVSLLRTALRNEGAEAAIRTYARKGYRFCAPVLEEAVAGEERPGGDLDAARGAFEREAWIEARDGFARADRGGGLEAADLEKWANAAEFEGRLAEAVVAYERAVAGYSASGLACAAARCALRLANVQVERREMAVARGWVRRAARHLEGIPLCHEVALLEWVESRLALVAGDMDEALARAERAFSLGRSLGDRDVEALGLLFRGLALVALGRMREGIELLDESGAAVLGERIGSWTGGIVYCGVIWASLNRGDWRRAAEWASHFTRWCSLNGVCGYPGLCRLHRAEVLALQGVLPEAEQEAVVAARELAAAAPIEEGDAQRVLGEVRLARGDLDGAEAAFRRCHEIGWDPNPGYALLQAARGNGAAAIKALEGALVAREWAVRQRRVFLLAHLASLAAAAGDIDRAREAIRELDERPELTGTPAASAAAAAARGELALAAGSSASAAASFREAIRGWRDVGSLLHVAASRLRLGEALAAAGDPDGAELEVAAAEAAYRDAALEHRLALCADVRRRIARAV